MAGTRLLLIEEALRTPAIGTCMWDRNQLELSLNSACMTCFCLTRHSAGRRACCRAGCGHSPTRPVAARVALHQCLLQQQISRAACHSIGSAERRGLHSCAKARVHHQSQILFHRCIPRANCAQGRRGNLARHHDRAGQPARRWKPAQERVYGAAPAPIPCSIEAQGLSSSSSDLCTEAVL